VGYAFPARLSTIARYTERILSSAPPISMADLVWQEMTGIIADDQLVGGRLPGCPPVRSNRNTRAIARNQAIAPLSPVSSFKALSGKTAPL